MNPQSWLDAVVRRNQVALSHFRTITEDALAEAMAIERSRRPEPGRIAGEVLAMNVRDLTLLRAADSPSFATGTLTTRSVSNRGIRLTERSSGLEFPVRKVPRMSASNRSREEVPKCYIQELLFDSLVESDLLPVGLHPVVVWSVGTDDMIGEFLALVVDSLKNLDTANVIASAAITPAVQTAGHRVRSMINDDFEDLVGKMPDTASDETGDTASGS